MTDACPRWEEPLPTTQKTLLAPRYGSWLITCCTKASNASGFLLELRIAGEDPTAVVPGTDRILVQPTPERGAADLCDNAATGDFPHQVAATETGQGQTGRRRQFAGQGFNLDDDFWGGKRAGARVAVHQPNQRGVPQRSACAICRRSVEGSTGRRRSGRWAGPEPPGGPSSRARLHNMVTYTSEPWSRALIVRHRSTGSHMGFFLALSRSRERTGHSRKGRDRTTTYVILLQQHTSYY